MAVKIIEKRKIKRMTRTNEKPMLKLMNGGKYQMNDTGVMTE